MSPRLVLASSSESRRRLLEDAGFAPEVIPSHAEESGVEHLKPADAVLELARRKARAVASEVGTGALVVGCDSMLELDGAVLGKPVSPAEAVERWRQMSGRAGVLHTGHCVIDTNTAVEASATNGAVVRFGHPSERELEAYAATGEPLRVAGAFTLEGRSAPWIDGIEGNAGTVQGLSLAVLRRLLADLGVELIDLWA
ncbi:MAG TPA: nucleoside triphosphate pyrophosphatase [Acidimicrobiales bacterium]|nr:nucleoside triphosphate pyrophosphatase [Acidimicrobiales bacterium]